MNFLSLCLYSYKSFIVKHVLHKPVGQVKQMYKNESLLLYNTEYVGTDLQKNTHFKPTLYLLTSYLHDLTLCLFMCCNQEKVYIQTFFLKQCFNNSFVWLLW